MDGDDWRLMFLGGLSGTPELLLDAVAESLNLGSEAAWVGWHRVASVGWQREELDAARSEESFVNERKNILALSE